jgi:hypothetical protein
MLCTKELCIIPAKLQSAPLPQQQQRPSRPAKEGVHIGMPVAHGAHDKLCDDDRTVHSAA